MKRMNYRTMMVFALLFLATTVHARFNAANRLAPKSHIGLRAGFSFSEYNVDDRETLVAPTVGLAMDFKIASVPLYLETGAYYMNMGTKFEERNTSYTIDNHSVMVPVAVSYHFYATDKLVIQPFIGFFSSYGFDNEQIDFGVREGIGITYGQSYAGIGMNVGLMDQSQENKSAWVRDANHLSLVLSVGINF